MKRYLQYSGALIESATGNWMLVEDHEAIIKRQASAARSGMDAAKAISSNDVQRAARLRAESSPDALESEPVSTNPHCLNDGEPCAPNGAGDCMACEKGLRRLYAEEVFDAESQSVHPIAMREIVYSARAVDAEITRLRTAATSMLDALKFVRRLWAKDDVCGEIAVIEEAIDKWEGRS